MTIDPEVRKELDTLKGRLKTLESKHQKFEEFINVFIKQTLKFQINPTVLLTAEHAKRIEKLERFQRGLQRRARTY